MSFASPCKTCLAGRLRSGMLPRRLLRRGGASVVAAIPLSPEGDWAGFGAQLDAMRGLLEELNQQSTGH